MTHHQLWKVLALSLLLPACFSTALAQQASLTGRIADSRDAVIAGAVVKVTNLDTGITRQAETNSEGFFTVPFLQPGNYRVTVEAKGFKTATRDGLKLTLDQVARTDFVLEPGELTQIVQVTAESPTLQSDASSLGSLINERAVQDLPVNGRNYIRLATLAAGAGEGTPGALSSGTRPDDRRRSSALTVNGQDSTFNNFLIDGMDNNERFIGTVIVKPSIDALAELKVETNLYSAEYGRTAGGVVNLITRSGSNDYHGSAFEFLRNEKLDARNFFAPSRPKYKQNQFGGSFGGPIRKNRTFFFGDYEGLRVRQGLTYTSTVPTPAMRQGNFSGVSAIYDPATTRPDPNDPTRFIRDRFENDTIPAGKIDPVAQRLINLYPLPNRDGLVNNYVQTPTREQRDDTFDVRLDHKLSDRDQLFGRYSFNDTHTFLPPELPLTSDGFYAGGETGTFAGTTQQRAQAAQLNYLHTFSSSLVMESKFGFERYAVQTLPPNFGQDISQQLGIAGANIDDDSSGLSQVTIAGFRTLGEPGFIPIIVKNNVFQGVGNLTYVWGGHSLKFGGDLRRRQVAAFQSASGRGMFAFDANFTSDPSGAMAGAAMGSGNAMASLLLGYPATTTRSKYLVSPGLRLIEWAGYLQDNWRVRNWLTLNIGARYEYFSPITEVADRISNVDLSTGKIIVAGQNGVSRSAGVRKDWNNIAPRFGFAATVTPRTVLRGGYGISFVPPFIGSNLAFRNPPFVSLFTTATTPLQTANRLSDGLPQPVATDPADPRGSLSAVAFDLATPYVQQFNLTFQRELPWSLVVTTGYVGALGRKQLLSTDLNMALPGQGAIQPRRPYVNAFPSVAAINMAATWGTGNYHAWQTSVERRFTTGLGTLATYTLSHNIDDYPVIGGGVAGQGPYPQLVNNRGLERANSNLDVRQRFTLILNYELPFARNVKGPVGLLAGGWQANAVTILQTGPPFSVQNGAARSNTGGGDRPNLIGNPDLPDSERSPSRWFNTAAFAAQPLFTIGNLGRNTLRAPGLKTLDFSIFKVFSLTERMRLQFRAEAFNLTNRVNFEVPGNALGTGTFGVISSAGPPRNIQLALKLLF